MKKYYEEPELEEISDYGCNNDITRWRIRA